MATPTPSTNTPSKLLPTFSSPAPRSVPHTGHTNMLSYDSPAVLNMLNDPGSGMGGVGMGISMSGLGMSSLGMSASAMGRADEAERTRRLQSILHMVGAKPGRVSEEGLLALCKRLGVQAEKNTAEAHSWMLLIGDEAVCDVAFKDDEIETVNLQTGLDGDQPELKFGPAGSQILVRSLKPLPGQSSINVTLERFAENLEKLLALDKLGNPQHGGVSCYNAIAGVYTSLQKLFDHEKKMALAGLAADTPHRDHKAQRDVMCTKSGRPRLNGSSCLGLSLEYWMDRRHVLSQKAARPLSDKGKNTMDTNSQQLHSYPGDEDDANNNVYAISIECESSPSTLYTPLRIANDWIGDKIEKPAHVTDAASSLDNILLDGPTIDWQDPKPTYLEAPEPSASAMDLSSAPGRLPNIRFVAKFNPPLVVPLAVYVQLYQSVGLEPRPEDFRPTTFVGLALRPGEIDPCMMGSADSTHDIQSARNVLVVDAHGNEKDVEIDMRLYLPKIEYSRTLESLPFSHPRQVVEMLPILRQYAYATSLLRSSFFESGSAAGQMNTSSSLNTSKLSSPPPKPRPDSKQDVRVGINLTYTLPAPRLVVHIPHPESDANPSLVDGIVTKTPLIITLDVHVNGELVIVEQNIFNAPGPDADVDMEQADKSEEKVKKLSTALEVCGDLGVWVSWLRREAGRLVA